MGRLLEVESKAVQTSMVLSVEICLYTGRSAIWDSCVLLSRLEQRFWLPNSVLGMPCVSWVSLVTLHCWPSAFHPCNCIAGASLLEYSMSKKYRATELFISSSIITLIIIYFSTACCWTARPQGMSKPTYCNITLDTNKVDITCLLMHKWQCKFQTCCSIDEL